MNIAQLLSRAGLSMADRPATIVGRQTVCDYRGLAARAAVLAGMLRSELGLRTGDRVALVMKNCPEYVEILFACWHAGIVVVPVNAKLAAPEIAYILDHSGARACFATPELAASITPASGIVRVIETGGREWNRLRQGDPIACEARAPDDLAWLFYTSGTTGRPKGAMLTHRNLLAMCQAYFVDVDSIAPGDGILHAAPMSHGSGLYILPHIAAGAAQIIPESGSFDADEVLDLCAVHSGVSLFAAPTMVGRLVSATGKAALNPDGLKTIIYGGGPMYVADCKRALETFGYRLAQIYGQGESPMTITSLARHRFPRPHEGRWEERLASVGVPFGIVRVRVVNGDGELLPAGETGEILVRGDTVMRGYWEDPKASREALRDGWLHTGDIGVFDNDGYLTLKDRNKDVIISGGANIYPREVEEVLLTHPAVSEVAVIGQPDPEWGESVVAFVVAGSPDAPDRDELDRLCLERVARFKRPRQYRFVEALPKNNYGKVLKTALRSMLREEQPDATTGSGDTVRTPDRPVSRA